MTRLYTDLNAWQQCRAQTYFAGKTLGFVPTMGYLHEGHTSLLKRSVRDNVFTVMSVFINPTQFDERSDLLNYPRDLAKDYDLADKLGVDFILQPDAKVMYPDTYRYKLSEDTLTRRAEGAARPGHFDGMLTVVMKLFNLVRPQRAYFGEKDYQQWQLVKGMAEAFHLPIEVIACPTVREADGLALSSRNVNLTQAQRKQAPLFHELLASQLSDELVKAKLKAKGFQVDYIERYEGRRLGAVRLGEVRLIDNVECE